MRRLMMVIKWFLLGLLFLLALLILGSSINHRLQTPREEAAYPPPGQMVQVNGHRLHVYSEGAGDLTLVFMSGSGTNAPTPDFRGLYRRLSDNYRTVVVERAGYGWSDDAGTSRDIDTVLDETRLALKSAGEAPPYVLLPHSMSGLEAIHWANRYPDEVAAIIGLDPATPPSYDSMPTPRLMMALMGFSARTGLIRLAPSICDQAPAAKHLSAAEKSAYCSIMYRRTLTRDMLAEVDATQANARQVAAEGIPDVPMYVFVSNGEGLALENWSEVLVSYVQAARGQHTLLDVGHYIHNEAADVIADESRAFLRQIERSRHDSSSIEQ